MQPGRGKVEASAVRHRLRALLRVIHIQSQMARGVISAACKYVSDACHLVTSKATKIIVGVRRRRTASRGVARARVGRVEVVGAWAWVDVPQASAKVGARHLIELIQIGDDPSKRQFCKHHTSISFADLADWLDH